MPYKNSRPNPDSYFYMVYVILLLSDKNLSKS